MDIAPAQNSSKIPYELGELILLACYKIVKGDALH